MLLFFLIGLENITIIDRETQAFFINIHLIHGVNGNRGLSLFPIEIIPLIHYH